MNQSVSQSGGLNERACPLCNSPDVGWLCRDARREYLICKQCELVFVPPQFFLSREEEKSVYDFHQNDVYDPHYRQFLNRLAAPLLDRLQGPSCGLDFGCGPGPALAAMLREAGHTLTVYDPFYAADPHALQQTYDFITATEVFEHLCRPGRVIRQLWDCLQPGGWLGVMTKRYQLPGDFPDWFYVRDPTHVAFFADRTFEWLADDLEARLTMIRSDVVLLQKSPPKQPDESIRKPDAVD